MIGAKVQATLWHVQFRYRNPAPPALLVLPGQPEPKHVEHIPGEAFVITADPTGRDLCEVSELAIRQAKGEAVEEFTITHVHRASDVFGLARLVGDGES